MDLGASMMVLPVASVIVMPVPVNVAVQPRLQRSARLMRLRSRLLSEKTWACTCGKFPWMFSGNVPVELDVIIVPLGILTERPPPGERLQRWCLSASRKRVSVAPQSAIGWFVWLVELSGVTIGNE